MSLGRLINTQHLLLNTIKVEFRAIIQHPTLTTQHYKDEFRVIIQHPTLTT